MTHDELIETLAADAAPVVPGYQRRLMINAVAAGAAMACAGVLGFYGVQPDLASFAHGEPLVMKVAYGLSLAGITGSLALALAFPDARASNRWRLVALPVTALLVLAVIQLLTTPIEQWGGLMLGSSWARCPWRILALSTPIFVGLTHALRQGAPTDLRAAGAAAGMMSGAVAATIYALACTENSALFVLVWYSLGIGLTTAMGAILGPRLLRW